MTARRDGTNIRRTVSDDQIVAWVREHPGATARQVAQEFYTVSAQLMAGSRLKRLTKAGLLMAVFYDGWKYSVVIGS